MDAGGATASTFVSSLTEATRAAARPLLSVVFPNAGKNYDGSLPDWLFPIAGTAVDETTGEYLAPPVADLVTRTGTKQIHERFPEIPALKNLYPFQWENEWNYGAVATEEAKKMWFQGIPFAIVAAYVVLVFGVQYLMRDRKAFNVKPLWRLWNLALAIFSFFGAARTVPYLVSELYQDGLYPTMCKHAMRYGIGASGFWTMLFVYSKVPELVDTAFIVLGKRKLIFLHWYHHVTVLLFCWHSYAFRSSAGIWFIAMNYSVHAVMYGYYFLTSLNLSPSSRRLLRLVAPVVTAMQISQMAVGVLVQTATAIYINQGRECSVTRGNWLAGLLMYASYFFLFASFAVYRYCLPGGKKKKSAGKKRQGKGEKVLPAAEDGTTTVNNKVSMPNRKLNRRKVHRRYD